MLEEPASEFNNIGLVINFTRACLLLEYQVSRRSLKSCAHTHRVRPSELQHTVRKLHPDLITKRRSS